MQFRGIGEGRIVRFCCQSIHIRILVDSIDVFDFLVAREGRIGMELRQFDVAKCSITFPRSPRWPVRAAGRIFIDSGSIFPDSFEVFPKVVVSIRLPIPIQRIRLPIWKSIPMMNAYEFRLISASIEGLIAFSF